MIIANSVLFKQPFIDQFVKHGWKHTSCVAEVARRKAPAARVGHSLTAAGLRKRGRGSPRTQFSTDAAAKLGPFARSTTAVLPECTASISPHRENQRTRHPIASCIVLASGACGARSPAMSGALLAISALVCCSLAG